MNQETKNMEVHHHSNVERKNFKEYFTQFILPKMRYEAIQFTTIVRIIILTIGAS